MVLRCSFLMFRDVLDRETHCQYNFLVQSPKDRELLGLEWGVILQVSNILLPDENSGIRYQYSKESDKIIFWCDTWRKRGWKFFKFFVRPCIVVGKYISKQFTVQFHLGEGESTVVLRTNCEMSLVYWISKIVDGDRFKQ